MTIPVWPADLPQWMLAPEFATAVADARTRTPMDVGPPKVRRRVSAAPQPVAGVIRCTQAQSARLERFWDEELQGGVLPFMFPGQVYNNAFLLDEDGDELLTEDGDNLLVAEVWLVQFAEEPPDLRAHHRSVVFARRLSLTILP
jgi:hypothetical protein